MNWICRYGQALEKSYDLPNEMAIRSIAMCCDEQMKWLSDHCNMLWQEE